MKNLKASQLKAGYIYSKNNYTVYCLAGFYILSWLYNSRKFRSLKQLKDFVKSN